MAANNLIASLAKEFMSNASGEVCDIITFSEAPWGLGLKLLPVQKFVLKSFYGMELDDRVKYLEIPDILNEKILYRMTEVEFLNFLYEEGRVNTKDVAGQNFHELVLVFGRRGTKCRSMGDLIPTTKGSMTFRELLKRSDEERIGIFTYDQDSLRRSVTYDYSIWDNGTSDCYRVETGMSFSETSSWNHPYLVWRESAERPEWVYAQDLREGDSIAVSNDLPVFGCSVDGRKEPKRGIDSLPIGVWNYIKRVKKQKGLKNVDFTGCYGARLRMQYAPSRRKVELYGKNIGDQWLVDMGTSDVRWDKVKSVVHVGDRETVDLCVKGTHIIGGELLSHNSTMASAISNYEFYKLVKRADPSSFFGFPSNTEIAILTVAPTDDQAGVVFNMIQSHAAKCPYLRDRILHPTMTYFDLQTDSDLALSGKSRASLIALAGGCSANSLRGRNAIVVILDEMSFFIDKENSRFSGGEVYKALTPSIASFGSYGRVLCISSPYAKFGRFYERYVESFDEPEYTLMFKMYTAMANPTVPSEILRAAYRRDKTGFMCEFGGEFSDRVTAWIESETEFNNCVHDRTPAMKGRGDIQYFVGIDVGFVNDGMSIAIVHKEGNVIVLDYADVWYGEQSDVWERQESIYHGCTKYKHMNLLKMSCLVDEVKALARWFPFKHGIYDQSNGYGLQELLASAGYGQLEMVNFTDALNAEVYQLTKRLYGEGLLDLYDHPVLIPEMLSLEAERRAKNKVIVEAPNRDGAHDDISDALVRAVWACHQKNQSRVSKIASGVGGNVGSVRKPAFGNSESMGQSILKKRQQHGPHPRGLDQLRRRSPGAVRR